ncbi:hypothetical protein ACFLUJ_08805 [Chloroflexota bacterium]
MKTGFDNRTLKRLIKGLFGVKSRSSSPHKKFPDQYYKNVWLSKKLHNGIQIVSNIEGISNKAAVDMLLGSGISRYIGEILKKHIEYKAANRERAEWVKQIATLKDIKVIRKYLAKHGVSEYRSKKAGL